MTTKILLVTLERAGLVSWGESSRSLGKSLWEGHGRESVNGALRMFALKVKNKIKVVI